MKRMKIFPKTFFYTLGLMLFIVGIAHLLLYLFITPELLEISVRPYNELLFSTNLNIKDYITQAVGKALPLSMVCCAVISILCSYFFSRKITISLKHISAVTEQMERMEPEAACRIHSKDEIGILAGNINHLYQSLLSAIKNLEIEKQRVSEHERSKTDFLRAASHELKTPVTALNAILENMILGVGKYKNYDAYLPECKEMTERLAAMIRDILETSRIGIMSYNNNVIEDNDITKIYSITKNNAMAENYDLTGNSAAVKNYATTENIAIIENNNMQEINLSNLLSSLCESYLLIARAKGILFRIDLPDQFSAVLPTQIFQKAVSNILANAVAYTDTGRTVSVYFDGRDIMIENECEPLPKEVLQHIFEPFYRPDFSRNRDNGGNGLGLYIVDTLLKTMNLS